MTPIRLIVFAGAAIFAVITIIILFFVFLFRKLRKPTSELRTPSLRPSPPATELSIIASVFDSSLWELTMSELMTVTNNFDPHLIIGDGSFGFVYKAKLSNGVIVAVKKLSPDAFQGVRELRAEIETLSKLRHKNIVKILGFCVSGTSKEAASTNGYRTRHSLRRRGFGLGLSKV